MLLPQGAAELVVFTFYFPPKLLVPLHANVNSLSHVDPPVYNYYDNDVKLDVVGFITHL